MYKQTHFSQMPGLSSDKFHEFSTLFLHSLKVEVQE